MKWSKIKSIMVYFLLAINIFMLIFIAFDSHQKTVIPEDVIDSAFKVLTDSGFRYEKSDFPDSYCYISPLDVSFYSASDLSDLFFGKQVPFRTQDNSLVATHEGAQLTVYSNYFTYTTKNDISYTSPKKLESTLNSLGIDTEGIVYDEKNDCFFKMYKNANLFNMYIKINLDSNGEICQMAAQWPKKITPKERLKVSFIHSIIKLKEAFPSGGNIEKIELGYSLQPLGGEKYKFAPVWRVCVDGELKILD